jgi:hypothetical protein
LAHKTGFVPAPDPQLCKRQPDAWRLGVEYMHRLTLLGLVVWSCLLAGCAQLPLQQAPESGPRRELQVADRALQQGQTGRAEELYSQLVQNEGLSRGLRIQAWQGLAAAANSNAHWELAELAMEQWAALDPDQRRSWEWQAGYMQVLRARNPQDWLRHAESVIRTSRIPWSVKLQTALEVGRESIHSGRSGQAWPLFVSLYAQARTQEQKQDLEQRFLDLLQGLDKSAWDAVSQTPPKEESPIKALVQWRQALRTLDQDLGRWPRVRAELTRILKQTQLATEDNLASVLAELREQYGLPTPAVALCCPLDGGYSSMGWKIAVGAAVAQWQLLGSGIDLQLTIINSQSGDWMKRIADLPSECRLVGGPLKKEKWVQLVEGSQTGERTFFPFRADLKPGTEGKDGFRFFPGTEDQIRPLVEVMQSEFGISRFAVMAPRSGYGQRLSSTFARFAQNRGAEVQELKMYSPRAPETWKQEVEDLLKGAQAGGSTQSGPSFRAVFIPDSFSQAQMLIPEFFYFDQRDLFFLGPTLWSQGVQDVSELDRKYFRLAVMTSPWIADSTAPGAQKLRQGLEEMNERDPDFWVALGYDFVRLASRVLLKSEGAPDEDMAAVLHSVQDFSWSMAPMSWDAQGHARQDLFVVQPGPDGLKPLKAEELKRR